MLEGEKAPGRIRFAPNQKREIVEHFHFQLESETWKSSFEHVFLIFMHFYEDDTNPNDILFVEFVLLPSSHGRGFSAEKHATKTTSRQALVRHENLVEKTFA